MKNNPVDIIIPTWNNPNYLIPCLHSILSTLTTKNILHIYVVNNGHKDSCKGLEREEITVLEAGENLGWEGGLELGLKHSKAPFVMFLNDDTFIPMSSRLWLNQLLQPFKNPKVAAVGPASNVVMGQQNIFALNRFSLFEVRFLIGFCMLVRREALDAVGGVDKTLPGGDDLDLSIRFRKNGFHLVADKEVFVYHHGFKTGERVYGTSDKTGGWNSYEFKEKTDFALIRKHGFRQWYETMMGIYQEPAQSLEETEQDSEGNIIRKLVTGGVIYDLGCGGNKTLPNAIGIDMIKKDELIDSLHLNQKSQADIQADVSEPLPVKENKADYIIARHILEHLIDPISVLKQWLEVLKKGGKLIIAVPNQGQLSSIPMNIEHVHGWNPPAMKALIEQIGLKVTEQLDGKNGISFITVAEKL